MRTILTALLVWGFTITAFARIGENEAQCEERYGKVISREQGGKLTKIKYLFFVNGENIEISASFINGRVAAIHYHNKSHLFSDSTISTILKVNSEEENWRKVKVKDSHVLCWKRENGVAIVIKKKLMIVCGKVWNEYSKNKENKANERY
jgi:hypothetical protein